MIKTIESESIKLLTHTIRQHTHMCNSLINEVQETEQLTISGFSKLNIAKISALQVTRSSNILECLLGLGRTIDELHFENFNVRNLADEMCETVTGILSGHLNIPISFVYDRIGESASITVDRSRIEQILFSMLYYCSDIPKAKSKQKNALKIEITESDISYTFSIIISGVSGIENPFDIMILSDMKNIPDQYFSANMNTASLLVSKKLADDTGYQLNYHHRNNTTRFELVVPKDCANSVAGSIIPYTPNTTLLLEIFSYMLLEKYEVMDL